MKLGMRTKISLVVVTCVLLTAICCGAVGIACSITSSTQQSKEELELFVGEKKENMNGTMMQVQSSVDVLAEECLEDIDDFEKFQTDADYVTEYTNRIYSQLAVAANNTEGALTCYIRYNPDFTDPTSGIFLTRNDTESEFESVTPTDFTEYDPSDLEHVGWYYTPVNNGAPLWMDPYVNANINVYMISYVVPLYIDGTSVGIVGMDIDFTEIQNAIAEETIFDEGYTYLLSSSDSVLYHPELEVGTALADATDSYMSGAVDILDDAEKDGQVCEFTSNGGTYYTCYETLTNGMKLGTIAKRTDVISEAIRLGNSIALGGLVAFVIATLVGVLFGVSITRPLENLTKEIEKMEKFDFRRSDTLEKLSNRKDEIGTMGKSAMALQDVFTDMVKNIRGSSDRVVDASTVMDTNAGNASSSVSEIETAITDVADGATNQAGETETVDHHVIQMGDIVDETSSLVESFKANSENMKETSDSAHEILAELSQINQQTKTSLEELKQQTDMTGGSVEQIQNAVQVITDIAEETNLLALNASIEAARAGEQGKGFAVVATQIQKLAEQSNASASEIQNVIKELLVNSNKSSKMMNDIAEVMEKQDLGLSNTEDAFNMVIEEVDHSLEGIAKISEKTEELNRICKNIIDIMENLSGIAQGNAASAEETSSITTQVDEYMREISNEADVLHKIAMELQESISIFTIE